MSRPQKRSQREDTEEPAQEDDLAVAASFAHVPLYQFNQPESQEVESAKSKDLPPKLAENKSDSYDDSDDGQENDSDPGSINGMDKKDDATDDNQHVDTTVDDDDDESEVDLTEALARMIDDDGVVDTGTSSKLQRPKTEHEVDPYSTPLDELQSNFQLNLTVEEGEHLRLADGNIQSDELRLCPAGHISCHMVDDRTIVVESTEKHPLDEGSLLVIRLNDDEKLRLIPLGKVFEVFGPISRPLYTIRLPPPPSNQTKMMKKKIPPKPSVDMIECVQQDENEIALSDTEGGGEETTVEVKEGDSDAKKQHFLKDDTKEHDPDQNDVSCQGVSNAVGTHTGGVNQDLEKAKGGPRQSDNWSATGAFTAILAASPRQIVYYIENEVKLLDTFAIMKNSGKGCDASNLFDEEVLNSNELYFSDDEEERQFKSKKKKGVQVKDQGERQGQRGIPGFHVPTSSPIPPPPSRPVGPYAYAQPQPSHPHYPIYAQQAPQYQPPGFQPPGFQPYPYDYAQTHPYHQPPYPNPPLTHQYPLQVGHRHIPPAPYPYPLPPDTQDESDTVYYQ